MGFWDTLLKAGGKAARSAGKAAAATGRSAGQAVLHPSQTLRGAGQAMKTAAIGSAAGYVAWEKLTTDKSVARIVGDTVIGESATNALAGTTEDIQELKGKAGEAAEAVGGAAASISSSLNGVSNFIGQATGGGLGNMIGVFFSNLGRGNVSGLSIAGLIAAAFLVFGRTGWLGKIAGLFLGMMLIGNNAGLVRTEVPESAQRNSAQGLSTEEGQVQGGGMRR